MLSPCICNVVISCWKFGAYGYVICRGGTDMCFVPGSGWKHLDLEQYRISGLTGPFRSPCGGPLRCLGYSGSFRVTDFLSDFSGFFGALLMAGKPEIQNSRKQQLAAGCTGLIDYSKYAQKCMKVQAKHGKVTQNMHGANRNYRYVWDVSTTHWHFRPATQYRQQHRLATHAKT